MFYLVIQFYTVTNILFNLLKDKRNRSHWVTARKLLPSRPHHHTAHEFHYFQEKEKHRSLNKYNLPLSSLMQSSLISDSGIMRPLKKKTTTKNHQSPSYTLIKFVGTYIVFLSDI